ncbi:MFS transporter [Micromonospora sp. MS34]|uniref:MFS transporter n=1 Tax=Micromonospora sp. MS34 TaxID=3385971 RepID=UPI0039A098BA
MNSTPATTRLHRGTREYRQTSAVLFAAGFMAFSLLYVVQGTLPAVSAGFGVSPATASLTLSFTTLPLAVAVVVAASWSEGMGRRSLLVGALLGAAVLTVGAAASPTFGILLVLRILTGLVLAGLPAVAMAYVAEEFHPSGLGTAMGLYISGTGLGGMAGRLAGGLLASALSWRLALAMVGGSCLLGGIWVALRLPSSRNFVPVPGGLRSRIAALREPLGDWVIIRLAGCGFVLMGSLVSYFNYLQYRLSDAPFRLPPSVVALVFAVYVFGTVSANWMGRLTDRHGRRSVLYLGLAIMAAGALASLSGSLPLVLAGTAALVFGFFGSHSVTSGWVNAWATRQRAQASGLYLFGYHLGSSVAGFIGGLFFGVYGWSGEVGTVIILLAGGVVAALRLPNQAGSREEPDAS